MARETSHSGSAETSRIGTISGSIKSSATVSPADAQHAAERRDQALRHRQRLDRARSSGRAGGRRRTRATRTSRARRRVVTLQRVVERRLPARSRRAAAALSVWNVPGEAAERAGGDQADERGQRVAHRSARRVRLEDRLERELAEQHLDRQQDGDEDLRGRREVEEPRARVARQPHRRAREPGQAAHRPRSPLRREVVRLAVERLGLGRSLRAVVCHRTQDKPGFGRRRRPNARRDARPERASTRAGVPQPRGADARPRRVLEVRLAPNESPARDQELPARRTGAGREAARAARPRA